MFRSLGLVVATELIVVSALWGLVSLGSVLAHSH
jgi:hypothetical protein